MSDLSRQLLFTDVPIMAKKGRLMDIEPTTDDKVWSVAAINFCTEDIVETSCHINIHDRCDSNDEFPCSITNENGEDLNSLLISQSFAKLVDTSTTEKNLRSSESIDSETFSKLRFNPDDLCDVADYKGLFELTKVNKEIDKQTVSLPSSKKWNELYDEMQLKRDSTDDKRTISTSTSIYEEISSDSIIDRIKSSFEQFRLDICTRCSVCEIMMIFDPINVVIAPENAEYSNKYKEMMSYLQKAAPCLKPLNVFEEDSKCIAYSREDKLWKRAMIIEEKLDSSNEIAIVFVDSLQISSINAADIRAFPEKELFMLPLKYIEAQLYKLKPNRRLRPPDVANELRNVLRNALKKGKAYVKIISVESKPHIEIYGKHSMKEVVYSSLIAEGFYSKLDSIPL